ncbi:response regulator [Leptospira sp. WS39.C2]
MLQQVSKVFLIEDDVVTTFLIKTLMEKFSFATEILTFQNGAVALDALNHSGTYPDLLFLDLNMPIMNGWEFLDQIKGDRNYSQIPIYILTSSIDPADKSRSHHFPNVKGYLVKPLGVKDLKSIQWEGKNKET